MVFKERYDPVVIGVDTAVTVSGGTLGGFLTLTSGTITVAAKNSDGTSTTIINGVAVTAGVYTPMPFHIPYGATVTTAGGASGTLAI